MFKVWKVALLESERAIVCVMAECWMTILKHRQSHTHTHTLIHSLVTDVEQISFLCTSAEILARFLSLSLANQMWPAKLFCGSGRLKDTQTLLWAVQEKWSVGGIRRVKDDSSSSRTAMLIWAARFFMRQRTDALFLLYSWGSICLQNWSSWSPSSCSSSGRVPLWFRIIEN